MSITAHPNNNNGLCAGYEWYLCLQRLRMGLEK